MLPTDSPLLATARREIEDVLGPSVGTTGEGIYWSVGPDPAGLVELAPIQGTVEVLCLWGPKGSKSLENWLILPYAGAAVVAAPPGPPPEPVVVDQLGLRLRAWVDRCQVA